MNAYNGGNDGDDEDDVDENGLVHGIFAGCLITAILGLLSWLGALWLFGGFGGR